MKIKLNDFLMELNEISGIDENITFFLNTSGFVDALDLYVDGNMLNLYNSEEDSLETEGDLISLLYHKLEYNIEKLKLAQHFIHEFQNASGNKLTFSKCPACFEEEYDEDYNSVVCSNCGKPYNVDKQSGGIDE